MVARGYGPAILFCFFGLVFLAGCGSGSENSTTAAPSTVSDKSEPTEEQTEPPEKKRHTVPASKLTAGGPAKRVMQCIALEGGFIEPLAPVRNKRQPPSHFFAHGVGPGETHIAIYLGTSPREIDELMQEYDEIGEYHASKTADGRNLVLNDGYPSSPDREVAFHCLSAATR
jgi:hypothetical protein